MKKILEKATKQLVQHLPFVIYKKPYANHVIGLFQKNDLLFSVNDFIESGFVFASFDGSKTVLIPENQSEIIQVPFIENETYLQGISTGFIDEMDKHNFENLVAKGIHAIENNEFKKVVLSRKESINLIDFDLVDAFEKLVQSYPSTFVYCFFHPNVGIWLGATPEQLLKVKANSFETIALAGTQKGTGSKEVIWQTKEKVEQQFVVDYIVEKLEKVASKVTISKPYSVKAGSIWHIKTDISGIFNLNSSLQEVIQLLHPTPAVCGYPKEKAKSFILDNENYDRTFYTGYLGELNSSFAIDNVSSDLFVNLRCMQICDSQANLYIGCGITKDSVPQKEWEESINKSVTMKKILDTENGIEIG